jgi:hypothetical protein
MTPDQIEKIVGELVDILKCQEEMNTKLIHSIELINGRIKDQKETNAQLLHVVQVLDVRIRSLENRMTLLETMVGEHHV